MRRVLPGLLLISLLAACTPKSGHPPAAAASPLDQDALNTDIDREIGGLGTCVILADADSGFERFISTAILTSATPRACRRAPPFICRRR